MLSQVQRPPVNVFQTVQSEEPLSEEGGTKLNISSAVLEESRRINKMAEGLFFLFIIFNILFLLFFMRFKEEDQTRH